MSSVQAGFIAPGSRKQIAAHLEAYATIGRACGDPALVARCERLFVSIRDAGDLTGDQRREAGKLADLARECMARTNQKAKRPALRLVPWPD